MLAIAGAFTGVAAGLLASWLFVHYSGWPSFSLSAISLPLGIGSAMITGLFLDCRRRSLHRVFLLCRPCVMNRLYFLFSLLPFIPFSSLAWSDTASLQPSQVMPRQGLPASSVATTVSLNDRTIDLTLSDAIYLGLRDNRSIRSIYLDRIAQKFDLRVAGDRFTPKLMLSAGYISERNQDDRWHQGKPP